MRKNRGTAYGVIGLGRFGTALAIALAQAGKEVIAIDRSEEKIKNIRRYTDYAFVAENLSMETLKEIGIQNCDVAIICIGEKVDVSILTTMSAIELGVPHVIAKATSEEQGAVLKKIGAEVVYPERDMALRLGKKLVSDNFLDFVSLSNSVEIRQIPVGKMLIGKSVQESDIRRKYKLNIIAIENENQTNIEILPDYHFQTGDIIVVIGKTENMDKFELGIAVQKVYDFLWDELCDWYIEMAKVRLWKAEEDPKAANDALWTLRTALTEGLKLLHPYMPFITEEIYCTLLPEEESIMISEWPVYREERNFPDAEKAIEGFKEVVRGIRNTRTEMNVPNNRKTSLHIVAKDAETAAMYENSKKSFVNLAFAKEILVQTDKNGISEDAVSVVVSNAVVYMPLEDLIDKDKEIERLTKETERLTKEIARCEGMLNNPNFVNKAPAAKVDAEKDKLAKYKEMMDKVKGQLEQLKK